MSKRRRAIGVAALASLSVALVSGACAFVRMPGVSHVGPLPAARDDEKALAQSLRADVEFLAARIGERNYTRPDALDQSVAFLNERFTSLGYDVVVEDFVVDSVAGVVFKNLVVEKRGVKRPDEIVLIGAHYDTAPGTPGANDNGTGVAILLAIAAQLQHQQPERTVRFVAFANEEPPFFDTRNMGSRHTAARIKAKKENVVAMLSLETLGCYSDVEGSQSYPFPFDLLYPSTGNFVGFVSDMSSVALTRKTVESFRSHAAFPSEGAAVPGFIPGIYWSDHASFWAIGVPAVMVTDTAPFRYQYYHTGDDVASQVDFDRLARITRGLVDVTVDLAHVD